MYIRRKVFSRFVDESGEEKLFSTTEFSYMTEEEQREFADKEDEDEDEKLDKDDEKIIKRWQKKRNKKLAELKQAAYEGDKDAQKKMGKKVFRTALAAGSGIGALTGATFGLSNGDKPVKDALKGAGIGAAAGAGLGALLGNEEKKSWKHLKKSTSRSAETKLAQELDHDQLAVANGKMSKKDFIKKWGN